MRAGVLLVGVQIVWATVIEAGPPSVASTLPLGEDAYKYVSALGSVEVVGRLPGMRADTVVSASLIREARMRAGLSQVQLAERSGKAKVQIGRWETGVVAPSLDTLLEIVRVCGFDLPLMLELHRPIDDTRLTALQRYSPERRVQHMLDRLDESQLR
jgi:transcriptional regulator with XRE-family HTH domain